MVGQQGSDRVGFAAVPDHRLGPDPQRARRGGDDVAEVPEAVVICLRLDRRVDARTDWLHRRGIRPRDPVAVWTTDAAGQEIALYEVENTQPIALSAATFMLNR